VADPDGRTAFVESAEGGIDAIDLERGKRNWHSVAAQRPLLVLNNRLLAEATEPTGHARAQLVLLDLAERGKKAWQSDPLPGGTFASETDGSSFCHVWSEDGRLNYHWAYAWAYSGGAAPPADRPLRGTYRGAARIDLRSGRVTEGRVAPDFKRSAAPDVTGIDRSETGERRWTFPARHRGESPVTLEVVQERGKEALLWSTSPAGGRAAQPPRELLRGGGLTVLVPAGGDYLLVRRPEDGEGGLLSRPWKVFRLSTGQPELSAPAAIGTDSLAVVGGRIFFRVKQGLTEDERGGLTSKRHVVAMSWRTGRVHWRYPLPAEPYCPPAC
jgi:hypothetical protein